ncbi:MAG: PhnD/SsuA/transferrin family substrate-binding protein, partial [Desulfovibrionaceae bacterium]|nr:PhnD/SsuA/transferrin family substrate-binding protein [Desulfovibrionaceae bacterium]
KLAPTYMLSKMKEDIDTFFKSYIFTYSHDRSIEMVAHNLVDGAAVDGLIWEYMNIKTPSITAKTRIIKKSEPFGIPPVVVPPGLDPSLEEQLRN